jgi:16S rRNA processing protein RimM
VPLSSTPDRVKTVFVGEKPMEVERTWMHGDELILKFAGVNTISEAEKLAGAEVAIPFEQRAALGEDEFYESDLIGCEVFDAAGRSLGRVTQFEETGGTPLLHLSDDVLIPFAKSICTQIDTTNKRILVNLPDGLLDLNVPVPQPAAPNPGQ